MSGGGGSGGVHGQRRARVVRPHTDGLDARWIVTCVFVGGTSASPGARETGLNASVETHARARGGIGTHPSSEVSDKSGVLDQGRRGERLGRGASNGERARN
jgi:hypothetical protein